jgi:hypothetical protein
LSDPTSLPRRRQSSQENAWGNRLTESRKVARDQSLSVTPGTGRSVKPPPGKPLVARSTLHCVKSNPGRPLPGPPSHGLLRRHPAHRRVTPCQKTTSMPGVVLGSRVGHRAMSPGVGMSGRPNPRSRAGSGNTRSTVGGRPPRRRSPRSSRRSGKPATGRRGAGYSIPRLRGTRDA